MGKLSKAERVFMEIARELDGKHVFSDERSTANRLVARGLIECCGGFLDTKATLTDAGRAALSEGRE